MAGRCRSSDVDAATSCYIHTCIYTITSSTLLFTLPLTIAIVFTMARTFPFIHTPTTYTRTAIHTHTHLHSAALILLHLHICIRIHTLAHALTVAWTSNAVHSHTRACSLHVHTSSYTHPTTRTCSHWLHFVSALALTTFGHAHICQHAYH